MHPPPAQPFPVYCVLSALVVLDTQRLHFWPAGVAQSSRPALPARGRATRVRAAKQVRIMSESLPFQSLRLGSGGQPALMWRPCSRKRTQPPSHHRIPGRRVGAVVQELSLTPSDRLAAGTLATLALSAPSLAFGQALADTAAPQVRHSLASLRDPDFLCFVDLPPVKDECSVRDGGDVPALPPGALCHLLAACH